MQTLFLENEAQINQNDYGRCLSCQNKSVCQKPLYALLVQRPYIRLRVLGICTVASCCGTLKGAPSEVATANGRWDEITCGAAGRDNTKGLLTSADATSWRRALKIQVVKVSTDKAGDSEELGGVFA